jgi:VanZ family protein
MPAILWAFFIGVLCGFPGKDIPSVNFLELISFDKFVHASIFGVLHFLFLRSLVDLKGNKLFIITTSCIAYGGLLEILQGAVFIDRSADILDFIANTFGVLVSFFYFRKKIPFNETTN